MKLWHMRVNADMKEWDVWDQQEAKLINITGLMFPIMIIGHYQIKV